MKGYADNTSDMKRLGILFLKLKNEEQYYMLLKKSVFVTLNLFQGLIIC